MKNFSLTAVIAAGFVALTAEAQMPGAINQVDATQTRQQLNQAAQTPLVASNTVPQLYEGEESDLGPQSVLQFKPRKTLFEAQADVQFFHTDNMLLTEGNKVSTEVLVSTIEFALAPTPYEVGGGLLAPRIGYQHQWFDFGLDGKRLDVAPSLHLNDFDFNAQSVFADALWSRNNWTIGGGVSGMRLMQTSGYDEFYKELLPHVIVRRMFPVNDKAAFAASYEGNYHFTDIFPAYLEFGTRDANDRTDQSLLLNYTQVLCQHAVFQPYYRFKYTRFTDYPLGSRTDYLNTVGAAVYWIICPNFNVRAFVSYDLLESSNQSVPDYRKLDAGGGVNVNFRF